MKLNEINEILFMEFKTVLKDFQKKIESRITSFLDERINEAAEIKSEAKELLENIKEYNLRGGKRLRAAFCVQGFKAVGGADEEAILDAAVSLELLQSFLIIHDDIMDEDSFRRGGKAFHKIYEDVAVKRFPEVNSSRFGENVGIIAGDLLQSFGIEALIHSDFPTETKFEALKKLNEIIYYTSFGQIFDLLNECRKNPSQEDVMLTHTYKTAFYTVSGPLQLGAILGEASEKQLTVLNNYGIPLGQAFQLQDDILGIYGSEEKLGKPADSDLKEGKQTLLIVKAMEKGNEKQKKKIRQALGNRNLSREEAEEARKIIIETGSLDYSKKLIEELIEEAKKALNEADFNEEGKNFLLGVADYMLSREY